MEKQEKDTIDSLRHELENENRFTVAWRGYSKKEVNNYLQDIQQKHVESVEEEQKKTKSEQSKNEQLMLQIEKMNERIEELQRKLENREATEKSVVQKMIDGLKETNSNLMDENSRKQIKIAELEDRMKTMQEDVINYTEMLEALDKRLKEMLNEKISQCNDVIDAWEIQFKKNKNNIKEKMK